MSRIFSLFLVLLFAFPAIASAADTSSYMVEGVTVNVSGKSPNDARNVATASARRDAFLILLTRLELNLNVADNVTNDEISDMVRSEQIDNEKIAGNSYSATFNIMFAKDFVDHILAKKNTAEKKDEKVQELNVLIPVQMVKRRPILWEENNDWKKSIEKNLTKKSDGKKFVIPEADMTNISSVSKENVEYVDYTGLEPMISRYKGEAAYLLFFNYDEIENKVIINVSYIRKMQKKQIKLSFINVDRLSYEALMDKVAAKTIDYLYNQQTSENKMLTSQVVRLGIPINSMGNWLMIKNKIESSNLVSQFNIETYSRDFAIVSVNFIAPNLTIEEAFAKIGLPLTKRSENFYVLN